MSELLPAVPRLRQIAGLTPSDPASELRIRRAGEFVRLAEATLARTEPTSEVCARWSAFANEALSRAFELATAESELRTSMALFAYGKLGANELNLSSDVDLVVVAAAEDPAAGEWIRVFRRLLQDVSDQGFCFRLDFDLRPGGRMGPLIPTVAQFADYFLNYGEAWERLAFVRFRGICGDPSVIRECVDHSRAFTYRKHLDFTLMEDLKILRQRIHEQNWRRGLDGALDLKLGLGGIRDLELFVHTLQVIHGGRDPKLRVPSTPEALELLRNRAILAREEADFLKTHYWSLRHFENLLQAATDRQIQVLEREAWTALVPEAERDRLREDMARCQAIVTGLLGPVDPGVHSLPESESDQREWLRGLGYGDEAVERVWWKLQSKSVLSRQPERDELYRKRFLFEITRKLSLRALNRDLALEILHDFLRSIRAKATFFHLLLQEKELLDRLVLLFSTSPLLSRTLIQRPELLDSFLYQVQDAAESPDWDEFLARALERKLLSEMTAGMDFLADRDVALLTRRLSGLADEIVSLLLDRLKREHGSGLRVLAMGKWGGSELGVRSDLDLVFITDGPPSEPDFKTARRLISRLTEAQKGGPLYQLDFRLKPQGKGGPLLTTREELLRYLREEAEPWERQAYLKARFPDSTADSAEIRAAALSRDLTSEDWLELSRIRSELVGKSRGDADLKYARGGLVETEFILQLSRLREKETPVSSSTWDELEARAGENANWKRISEIYAELRVYEQALRLITTHTGASLQEDNENGQALASLFQTSFEDLMHRIRSLLDENSALLGPLDPRPHRS